MTEIIIIPEKKGKKLNCQRCKYWWVYTGNNQFVCSCPHCRTTVTIKKKDPLYTERSPQLKYQHTEDRNQHLKEKDDFYEEFR